MLVPNAQLGRDLTARPVEAGQETYLGRLGGQLVQGGRLCLGQTGFGLCGHDVSS